MIDSLYIDNFRLFRELEVKKLGIVNLIVGKNNTGKSCFLEALRIYGANASPDVLFDIIKERGEDWEIRMQRGEEQPIKNLGNPLRYLFNGYRFPEIGKNSIEMGSYNDIADRIRLHLRAYKLFENDENRIFRRIDIEDLKEGEFDQTELVIELEEHNKFKPIVRLNREPRFYLRKIFPTFESKINVQMVPTKNITDQKLSILWDNINVHPHLRKEVFESLKLIDDKIEEIVLVGRENYINPILIYNNIDARIPLKSMGDGITHLFHIILSLINSRGGLVLIDEFENGLHYSVQPKIWDFVFRLAKKLEVQVVATTHSWDCISSFQKTIQHHEIEGMLIHFGQSIKKTDEGKIIATGYDKDELQLATQANLEVR